jgi:predicted acetyltransferase
VTVTKSMTAELLTLDTWAFPAPQGLDELLGWAWPLDYGRVRALRCEANQAVAAMHASYAFAHFPVPGSTLAAAGLTWVAVHPESRRRGLLTSMIAAHFDDCRARNEAVSVLTASEPSIYGRFGYGLASQTVSLTLPRGARLRTVLGSDEVTVSFNVFDADQHLGLVSEMHARYGATQPNRPGWVNRETEQLAAAFIDDPESLRDGFESRRILIAKTDGVVTGYALFRRKLDWGPAGAEGVVKVGEVVGLDPATVHALWSRLLDLDLTAKATIRLVTLDDPLLSLLVDLRATQPTLSDNLWVRLIDAPTALASRQYSAPIDATFAVRDDLIEANVGCWRVRAEAFSDAVEVSRVETGEISLDVRELGALYLGGASASALANAGLLTGPTTLIQQVSSAFAWPLKPGCSWIF